MIILFYSKKHIFFDIFIDIIKEQSGVISHKVKNGIPGDFSRDA